MRYLNLSTILVFRTVSQKVKARSQFHLRSMSSSLPVDLSEILGFSFGRNFTLNRNLNFGFGSFWYFAFILSLKTFILKRGGRSEKCHIYLNGLEEKWQKASHKMFIKLSPDFQSTKLWWTPELWCPERTFACPMLMLCKSFFDTLTSSLL